MPATGPLAREIQTLAALEEGLSDDYVVYHGIHWTRAEHGHALFGEIDFVVVGPSGRLLLMEQKSGFLDETPEGLVKAYPTARRNVTAQMARSADNLRSRLTTYLRGAQVEVDTLLYCPDYRVRQPGSAGVDPARIVDASRRESLPLIVSSLLQGGGRNETLTAAIDRFLADQLELVPDASALAGRAEALYTRLSGGLAEWARRIETEPFRLRVSGTAGSGKTQLALAVLADAVAAGRRPLYVCYNRPLADHVARVAATGAQVATYHQLADRILRAHGRPPDFSQPDAFARLEAAFETMEPDPSWRFDEIVIDEGQDFRPAWRDTLLRLLTPEGRAWWLEDPLQNLYDREPAHPRGWVTLTSDRNYRTPADIVAALNRMLPLPKPLEAGSPITASELEILTWESADELMEQTRRAITRAIGLGFKREMTALVTYRGRENSRFTPLERLGAHRLRAFTGHYDLLGSPLYTEGDILIDSVYRFKGQAAPCVIFTEIDFEALDPLTVRKLFVGATRASMKLILVASRRAARQLSG